MIDEYEKQAEQFLKDTDTTFKAEFVKHDKYFNDDNETRDIYQFTFKRGDREFKGTFGQSLAESCFKVWQKQGIRELNTEGLDKTNLKKFLIEVKARFGTLNGLVVKKDFVFPTAYDVLSSLTKYEVEDFKDFCNEYGYNEDSIKALDTYKAVREEWRNVQRLWTDKEIEALQEIN